MRCARTMCLSHGIIFFSILKCFWFDFSWTISCACMKQYNCGHTAREVQYWKNRSRYDGRNFFFSNFPIHLKWIAFLRERYFTLFFKLFILICNKYEKCEPCCVIATIFAVESAICNIYGYMSSMGESPAAIRFFKFFNHMLRWWPLFRLINSMRFPSSTTRNRFYLMKQLSLRWRFNSSFIRVFFTNFMANMCKLLQSDWNRDHSGDRLILMQAMAEKYIFVCMCFFISRKKMPTSGCLFRVKDKHKTMNGLFSKHCNVFVHLQSFCAHGDSLISSYWVLEVITSMSSAMYDIADECDETR